MDSRSVAHVHQSCGCVGIVVYAQNNTSVTEDGDVEEISFFFYGGEVGEKSWDFLDRSNNKFTLDENKPICVQTNEHRR